MFDIGWSEMLVIAIVMIVVVGPKDLPKMLRTFGRTTSKLRAMAGDFRKQFDEALKEAELDDVKGLVDDVRKLNPANEIKQALNPMQKAAADVRAGLDAALNPKPSAAPSTPAASQQATVAPSIHDPAPRPDLAAPPVDLAAPASSAPAASPVATAKPVAPKTARASTAKAKPAAKPTAAPKPKAASPGAKKPAARGKSA